MPRLLLWLSAWAWPSRLLAASWAKAASLRRLARGSLATPEPRETSARRCFWVSCSSRRSRSCPSSWGSSSTSSFKLDHFSGYNGPAAHASGPFSFSAIRAANMQGSALKCGAQVLAGCLPPPATNLYEYQRKGLIEIAFRKLLILKGAILVVLGSGRAGMAASKKKGGRKLPHSMRSYLWDIVYHRSKIYQERFWADRF